MFDIPITNKAHVQVLVENISEKQEIQEVLSNAKWKQQTETTIMIYQPLL